MLGTSWRANLLKQNAATVVSVALGVVIPLFGQGFDIVRDEASFCITSAFWMLGLSVGSAMALHRVRLDGVVILDAVGFILAAAAVVFVASILLASTSVTDSSIVDALFSSKRLFFSLWSAMMLTSACLCMLGLDPPSWRRAWLSPARDDRWEDRLARAPCIATALGAWIGAAAIPLDWDVPWQSWPACSVLVAYVGFAVGSVISLLRVLFG